MKSFFALIFATLSPLMLLAQASRPPLPNRPGLYILANGSYQEMLAAPIQALRFKMGRALLNAYSLGLAGYRVVITIPGNTSPIQTEGEPAFVLVNTASAIRSTVHGGGLNPRALEIVKLDRKKNRRESNIVHGTTWNMSIGLPDAKWPFTVTPLGDSAYQLTISSHLPQGEYIVLSGIVADGYNGFDFTVVSNGKQDESAAAATVTSTPASAARNEPTHVSSVSPTVSTTAHADSSQLKETSSPSSGTLGVTGADWEQGGVRGVEIMDVFENGSAQLAGLHKGNVIAQVNGKTISSVQDLMSVLAPMGPGTRVSVVYLVRTNLGWMPSETVAILAKID